MSNLTSIQTQSKAVWESLISGDKTLITIGNATCGRSAGSIDVMASIEAEAHEHGLECNIIEVGCIGLCYLEPIVCVQKPGQPMVVFGNVTAKQVKKLVADYLLNDQIPQKLVLGTIGENVLEDIPKLFDLPVLKPQVRRALNRCGFIDPTDLHHYFANSGYTG